MRCGFGGGPHLIVFTSGALCGATCDERSRPPVTCAKVYAYRKATMGSTRMARRAGM